MQALWGQMDEYEPIADGPEHATNPNGLDQFSGEAILPQCVGADSAIASDLAVGQGTVDVEVVCPRCGKSNAKGRSRCLYCSARLEIAAPTPELTRDLRATWTSRGGAPDATALITRLLICYVLLLCTNLIGHWIASGLFNERMSDQSVVHLEVILTAVFEAIDTLIVLVALLAIPVERIAGPQGMIRQLGWLFGPVILAIALALNLGYHALLQNYVQFPNWTRRDLHMPIEWSILLVCVQPGIMEELFFRYLALGTLTRVMGVATAVLVTSVMFGMAHSSVLLSIPILTVVGVALGIVRVWSGSIVLPMLLHSLHNAVVIYFETTR